MGFEEAERENKIKRKNRDRDREKETESAKRSYQDKTEMKPIKSE